MIFCRRKKLDHNVKLLIDGQAVDEVQKTKFLGIINNNKLTWKWHIDHIAGKYHSCSTRSAHHLHIPYVKLDLSKTGIKYRGTIVWNIIAESGINLEVSEAAFKKSLIKLINTDRL